jgi:hypothetical protein
VLQPDSTISPVAESTVKFGILESGSSAVDSQSAATTRPKAGGAFPGSNLGADDVAGPSTNRGLLNYAKKKDLGDCKASKGLSKVDVKYLGIDTADFSVELTEDELSYIEPMLLGFIGQGEISAFDDQRFVVSLIKLPYRYKVSVADGVEVYIPSKGHAYLGMKVSAGARVCLSAEDIEHEACEVIGWFLLGEPEQLAGKLCLSRVDVCLDVLMTERAFQHISGLVARKSSLVIARARMKEPFIDGDRYTGFAVGKDAIRLRVYDKGLKAKRDGTLQMWGTVWSDADGQGEGFAVPDGYVLARFEWQLRRGFLRELADFGGSMKVRTLADFKQCAPSMLEYLCNDWFKLCGPGRGKKHERPMLPVWKAITAGFVSGVWSDVEVEVKRKLRCAVPGNVDKLLGMAAGCLASVAAVQGQRSGQGEAKSDVAAVAALQGYMRDGLEQWQAGRDRRFKQLAYNSKNMAVYRDIWTGEPMPIGSSVEGGWVATSSGGVPSGVPL